MSVSRILEELKRVVRGAACFRSHGSFGVEGRLSAEGDGGRRKRPEAKKADMGASPGERKSARAGKGAVLGGGMNKLFIASDRAVRPPNPKAHDYKLEHCQ
jgi:hypothetical protein